MDPQDSVNHLDTSTASMPMVSPRRRQARWRAAWASGSRRTPMSGVNPTGNILRHAPMDFAAFGHGSDPKGGGKGGAVARQTKALSIPFSPRRIGGPFLYQI